MWPARCACSCGRWAGASSRPAYSSGLRTSTRFCVPIAATASSRKARIEGSCSVAVYDVAARVGSVVGQLAGVELPLLAAAVEQLDVLVAVELEVPVGVGGEPVVVAAVEHDGVVVGDAALGEQRLELRLVDEVAADLVLEVGGPVELDGALDVALVVGGGVLVDLDEDDAVGVEVVLDPLGGDERVLAAHGGVLLVVVNESWWTGRGWSGGDAADEQVDLASQAEGEDGVEQGGDERGADGDLADERSRRPGSATRPTSAKARPTAWAKRGGSGASSSVGGASRGRTSVRKSQACGVACTPRTAPIANSTACTASRTVVGGLRQQQHGDEHHGGDAGGELRTARVDAAARRAGEHRRGGARRCSGGHVSPGWSAQREPGAPGTARRGSHRRA